jgi:hypothetical protein
MRFVITGHDLLTMNQIQLLSNNETPVCNGPDVVALAVVVDIAADRDNSLTHNTDRSIVCLPAEQL